jgi:hypothetical protein
MWPLRLCGRIQASVHPPPRTLAQSACADRPRRAAVTAGHSQAGDSYAGKNRQSFSRLEQAATPIRTSTASLHRNEAHIIASFSIGSKGTEQRIRFYRLPLSFRAGRIWSLTHFTGLVDLEREGKSVDRSIAGI